ncbi:hypothetical protein YC2023_057696 [Brassica napus]
MVSTDEEDDGRRKVMEGIFESSIQVLTDSYIGARNRPTMTLLTHSLYLKAHITIQLDPPRRVQISQLFVYKRKMESETLQTESEITKKSLFSSVLSNSIIAAANLLKKYGGRV